MKQVINLKRANITFNQVDYIYMIPDTTSDKPNQSLHFLAPDFSLRNIS